MVYHGYAGNVLHVDLTNRAIAQEPLDEGLIRKFIGGMGINTKLAFDCIHQGADPLSPDNALCHGAGPFAGTLIPGCSRCGIIAKSPLTGFLGESHTGVSIAPMLKYAGYDHLVVTGRADMPVYICIDDEKVEIRDASHLWGKGIYETTDALRQELGDYWISCIGPAGERMIRFSNIIENKSGMIARGGLGAVMGSKNLKAVAVRGTKGITVFNRREFKKIVDELRKRVAASPVLKIWRYKGMIIDYYPNEYAKRGISVTKNFSEGLPDVTEKYFTQKEYAERIWSNYFACISCPAGDKGVVSLRGGKYDGLTMKLSNPWGTPMTFHQAGIRNWDDAYQLTYLANDYGIDVFSAAIMIGFATELFEKGILSSKDTEGIELDWSSEAAFKLLAKIVRREGIGDLLAEGSKYGAARIGRDAEKYAVHVKGMEPTMELRAKIFVENLGQLVDPRGAHHARGYSITYVPRNGKSIRAYGPQIGIPKEALARICPDSTMDNQDWNRPRLLKWVNDYNSFAYSLGQCMRVQIGPNYNLDLYRDLFYSTTGIEMGSEDLLRSGERVWNLQRLFNAREGASRKDDLPPPKMLHKSLKVGDKTYPPIDEDKINQVLNEYYDESGWDEKTGNPTMEKLTELDLREEGESFLSTPLAEKD